MKYRMSFYLAGVALVALSFGTALIAAPAPASAQVKALVAGPTAPPPVVTVTPTPTSTPTPQQPRPDFTRSYTPPTVPNIPDIPTRPDPGFPGGGSGDRGSLNQLQSLTSIGQLLAVPVATKTVLPSAVLHRLENRLPVAGQAVGNEAPAMEGRAGALKALESAKSIL